MSNRNYYNRSSSDSSGTRREFHLTEEMKELLPISRVIREDQKMFLNNGNTDPIEVPYFVNDIPKTINGLNQILIDSLGCTKEIAVKWSKLLSDVWLESESSEDEDNREPQKKKPTYLYVQKYTTGIPPAEAILIGGIQPALLQIIDGKAKLSREIPLSLPDNDIDIILRPLLKWSYISKEYDFSSEAEINAYIERVKKLTLDDLYNWVKSVWKKYIDADDFHIVICAADTFFGYFQDKLGTTHYLLFVGDNDVGKTNNLTVFQHLGYRALCDIDITPATIYRFQGSIEEGQGIILEDEIDDIDDQREKKKLYQGGYNSGKKVTRNDEISSGGRQPQSYYVCFKAFTAEKQPDSFKSKAFNERTFVINCFARDPKYDISEVIKAADDIDLKAQFDELVDVRRCLLIYRLLHCNDPIANVRLDIKNRDKQLCKPLIRLFKNTKALEEIKQSLLKLLQEKKDRKLNTVHAVVYKVLMDIVEEAKKEQTSLDKDAVILEFRQIWDAFVKKVEGTTSPKHPRSIDTTDYGLVSEQEVGSILRSRFGGEDARTEKVKRLKFSRMKLERLSRNYSSIDKITVDEGSEGDIDQ